MRSKNCTNGQIRKGQYFNPMFSNLILSMVISLSYEKGMALATEAIRTPSSVTTSNKKKKKKYTDSFFAASNDATEKSEKELNLVLAGLNALIPIEKSPNKKSDLLFSKSVTLLSLGKKYYLNGKLPGAKEKKETYLKRAMQSASEATENIGMQSGIKARALHVYGMSSLYMDNENKSVEYFEQAIKIDPNAKMSPRLSVFIGEHYFENEKFEQALPYYSQFFNRLTTEEKTLSLYKSAWCFLALKQYDNAEKSFLKIIGKKWAGDFGVDAVRDLAQTVSAYKTETEIIRFGVDNLSGHSTDLLADFYTNCYLLLLRQSGNRENIVLYNEILRLEKRPEKRVALAIKKLSAHQKGYASQQAYKDVMEIDMLITQASLKPETDLFRTFGSDLEFELKRVISAYVDTIAKKLKTPEVFSDVDIAGRLQKLLWFHVSWFPTSPSLPQTYMLAMDNCAYLKDADCSLRIGRLVLRQPLLKNVWHRARVEVIVALETLSKRDAAKYQADFVNELKLFADTQPTIKEWVPFTKKLTSIYMTNKKYAEAETYLIKILKIENTAENLYRKIFCQYNQNKFAEVALHINQIPKEGAFQTEIRSLVRESSLSLAQENIAKNNFENYEKYLFQFLSLQPEPAKADLAKSDYIQKLLERKHYDKVIALFAKTSADKKFNGALQKPMELFLMTLFSLNRFADAKATLVQGSIFGQYRSFDYYWSRTILSENESLSEKEIKILAASNPGVRLSILSLAAVSNPKLLKDYFRLFRPTDDKERKVWLLSRQMSEGEKSVALNSTDLNALVSVVSPDILPVGALKSEKLSKMIEFPHPNWSQRRLANITPDAMERVKSVRKQIIKDLKDQKLEVQKRLVINGLNVEKRMAWFFDESPIPEGLNAADLKEYKVQIDSFAQDYYQQINEYEKLLSLIISKENEVFSTKLTVPKNIANWKRPKSDLFWHVEQEVSKRKYLRALIVLESLKELNNISVEDHYRWRSFAVLNQFPHEFASNYLQDELQAFKQLAILTDWSQLVGVPLTLRSTASSVEGK